MSCCIHDSVCRMGFNIPETRLRECRGAFSLSPGQHCCCLWSSPSWRETTPSFPWRTSVQEGEDVSASSGDLLELQLVVSNRIRLFLAEPGLIRLSAVLTMKLFDYENWLTMKINCCFILLLKMIMSYMLFQNPKFCRPGRVHIHLLCLPLHWSTPLQLQGGKKFPCYKLYSINNFTWKI